MQWFDDSALTLAAFIPLVGLALVLLSMLRPQGLLGRKAEMQLRQ